MTPTSSHDHMKLGDHDHHQLQLFNGKERTSLSTISSHVLSHPSIQDEESFYPREAHQLEHQQEANNFASKAGSLKNQVLKLCSRKNESGQGIQINSCRHQNIPTKWLPTKLRLVRRMMGSDQTATNVPAKPRIKFEEDHKKGSLSPMEITETSDYNLSSTPSRVCSDCNTTKTPLWRSGPRGPKSLCNACGIRQRKARQALAAAADGTTPLKPMVQRKDKILKINTQISTLKKKSKIRKNNGSKNNKLNFEDFLISLSKNLAYHQVFPQDEKEAAILLMALSCGLVHG